MKKFNILGKPASFVKFLAADIDQDYEEDWHRRSLKLQARRWRKIRSYQVRDSRSLRAHHFGS